jgi:hypothetical protein
MRRFVVLLLACAVVCAVAIAPSTASAAFTQCPPVYKDTSCQFLVTVTDTETTVESDPTQGPYEGSDDALIGIQNSSSKPISSIPLSAEETLFGFENDGICSPGEGPIPAGCQILTLNSSKSAPEGKPGEACKAANLSSECGFPEPAGEPAKTSFPEGILPNGYGAKGSEISGYEGPTSWFTNIGPFGAFPTGSGVVNFSPAIAPGQSSYFSLESPPVGGFGAIATLGTTLSGGGQTGASISVVQGTPVTDTATLSGAGAPTATGPVSFNVYSDPGCTTLAIAAGAAKMAAGVSGPSTAISTLAPGKYFWQAHYSGNLQNQAATSVCGTEVLTVLTPTVTTTSQTGAGVSGSSLTLPAGTAVSDRATITGTQAKTAGGTVTYTLFKDKKCTVPVGKPSTGAVLAGVAGPSAAIKPLVGTYYWTASYSGDAVLNGPSASACGKEVLVVAKKANLGLPSSKVCLSRRKFIAHPRAPKGVKLVSVEVLINGKVKSRGKLTSHHTTINLIGLPKGTFKVSMVATTSKGSKYVDIRTFHTCVPKKHKK